MTRIHVDAIPLGGAEHLVLAHAVGVFDNDLELAIQVADILHDQHQITRSQCHVVDEMAMHTEERHMLDRDFAAGRPPSPNLIDHDEIAAKHYRSFLFFALFALDREERRRRYLIVRHLHNRADLGRISIEFFDEVSVDIGDLQTGHIRHDTATSEQAGKNDVLHDLKAFSRPHKPGVCIDRHYQPMNGMRRIRKRATYAERISGKPTSSAKKSRKNQTLGGRPLNAAVNPPGLTNDAT